MCGRYVLKSKADVVEESFELSLGAELKAALGPRYNIGPGQGIMAVWDDRDAGRRMADYLVWGLIPNWVKDPNEMRPYTNARSETLGEKASFRDSARYRRCIVPANGFYEWKRRGNERKPYYFQVDGGELIALAGIWSHWASPDGSEIMSVALITTQANTVMEAIHDRLPVIINRSDIDRWLDPMETRVEAVKELMQPIGADRMSCYPVGKAVNSGRAEGSELMERIEVVKESDRIEMDFMDQLFGED